MCIAPSPVTGGANLNQKSAIKAGTAGPQIPNDPYGGFPKLGVPFGGPYKKDYSILGSILGYPNFGKLPWPRKCFLSLEELTLDETGTLSGFRDLIQEPLNRQLAACDVQAPQHQCIDRPRNLFQSEWEVIFSRNLDLQVFLLLPAPTGF